MSKTLTENSLEELVVPGFPGYKRDFVKVAGEYLINSRFGPFTTFDITKNVVNDYVVTHYNKRGISSDGITILDKISYFLKNEVNAKDLKKAVMPLSDGIATLAEYEITDSVLAGRSRLEGHVGFLGGLMEGDIEEKKPSGYTSFCISKSDRKEYLNLLGNTLFDSYNNLKSGFKSEVNDKKFAVLVGSLMDKEDVNLAQIRTVNDYLRSVRNDARLMSQVDEWFEYSGLKGMHQLSKSEKIEALKKAKFKPMSNLTEKVCSHSGAVTVGGISGALAVSSAHWMLFHEPYAVVTTLVTTCIAVTGGIAAGSIGHDIDNDRETLYKIKEAMPEMKISDYAALHYPTF